MVGNVIRCIPCASTVNSVLDWLCYVLVFVYNVSLCQVCIQSFLFNSFLGNVGHEGVILGTRVCYCSNVCVYTI